LAGRDYDRLRGRTSDFKSVIDSEPRFGGVLFAPNFFARTDLNSDPYFSCEADLISADQGRLKQAEAAQQKPRARGFF
jgi:hypothetical protein